MLGSCGGGGRSGRVADAPRPAAVAFGHMRTRRVADLALTSQPLNTRTDSELPGVTNARTFGMPSERMSSCCASAIPAAGGSTRGRAAWGGGLRPAPPAREWSLGLAPPTFVVDADRPESQLPLEPVSRAGEDRGELLARTAPAGRTEKDRVSFFVAWEAERGNFRTRRGVALSARELHLVRLRGHA